MEYITQIVLKSKIFEVYKNAEGYLETYRSIGKEDADRRRERIFKDSERIVSKTTDIGDFIKNYLMKSLKKNQRQLIRKLIYLT